MNPRHRHFLHGRLALGAVAAQLPRTPAPAVLAAATFSAARPPGGGKGDKGGPPVKMEFLAALPAHIAARSVILTGAGAPAGGRAVP